MTEVKEDNRSIYIAKRNLEDLLRSGQERKRLTEQLQVVIAETMDEVAEALEDGAKIALGEVNYVKRTLESNIGAWEAITVVTRGEKYVFNEKLEPGGEFYLHNDWDRRLVNAPKKIWLFTANNLPRIINSFAVENEKVIDALRGAFEKLRSMAE